jgi:Zn-finger nucleic acid-binding protein
MSCPVCNAALLMSEGQGIEIDYCPKCRGVWLDRGELDEIIERSLSQQQPGTAPVTAGPQRASRVRSG